MSVAIGRAHFSEEEYEAGCCQLFVENLAHEALGCCAKSQVLADFLVEVSPELESGAPRAEKWSLHVDGASSRHGSGIGIHLVSPTGEVLERSFRLAFTASNNEAEYEALIAGMRLAGGIGVKKLQVFCDSQLVTHQFSGDYECRNDRMDAYLKVVQELSSSFESFELTKISRSDNAPADALAVLASTSDPDLRRIIPVESIDQPSINLPTNIDPIAQDYKKKKVMEDASINMPSSKKQRTGEGPPVLTLRISEPSAGAPSTSVRSTTEQESTELISNEQIAEESESAEQESTELISNEQIAEESESAEQGSTERISAERETGQVSAEHESVNQGQTSSEPKERSYDWQADIRSYITDGIAPSDKWEARRLRARCAHYTLLDGNVFRWTASGALLTCVGPKEVDDVMREVHEGSGGNHSGARALAMRIRNNGHYWPTMNDDCEKFVAKCEKCQRHAPIIHAPTELLRTTTPPYPFMRWAMDIVGPLPVSRQKKYILIMTDYFTKWVEAEAFAKIGTEQVQKFVWKNIICRHGLPYEIVTDNGTQFTSLQFEGFCAKWRIRLSKSTPRYPQGNGQAEATNKTIIDGLKKRLEDKKGLWADELDGVLWSHRTSPRRSTGRTPFSLAYGMEALAPEEISVPTLRRSMLVHNPALNTEMMLDTLDTLEEERGRALTRIQNYQQQAAKFYNKKVRPRHFDEGDLVLRKVFENTAELNAGKMGVKDPIALHYLVIF
ncbi:PREDICTED: uncharacterized protein LOC104738571 [Camelina sativa]|uniref:Uncharacterized protein LOC104738571 n=1 Tax=Camelina sativa TaxID=90675 RepID=A0ABM0VJ48_CAMSA|nr:PREDICTED: uncharacterized protein LOC104738571 [Camelina sativa]